jgi:serine/threonine-protein kinase
MLPWIAVLMMVIVFLFGFQLWRRSLPFDTTVPSVEGLRSAEAKQQISRAGLRAEEAAPPQMSETIAAGCVITSSPPSGRRVKSGRLVKLVISSGSAYTVIPDVTQLTRDVARDRLRQVDISIGSEEYIPDKTIAFEHVISMTPKAGTRVKRFTSVDLKISQGVPTDESTSISSMRSTTVTADLPKDGEGPAEVRIDVSDDDGTRTVYKEQRQPGETVTETVQGNGPMTIEVYYGDRLILTRRYP